MHQPVQEVEIVTFGSGRIAGRTQFDADDPIRSAALSEFALTPGDMLDEG